VIGEVSNSMGAKQFVYNVVEIADSQNNISKFFDIFIINLIFLNIMAVILETVVSIGDAYGGLFLIFEAFSVAVFTIEYIARLWTCDLKKDCGPGLRGRLKYALTPMALIDLLAILPFYLSIFVVLDLRFLRMLRLFRILRLLKLVRYFETLRKMGHVLKVKKEELTITISVVIILLVFASSFMYFIENSAQPDNFSSIPASMWWAVATLTTVGYGDVYPVTPLGKALGSFIAMLGVGMVALPAGILGSGFMEMIQKDREEKTCPHCGKLLHDKEDQGTV